MRPSEYKKQQEERRESRSNENNVRFEERIPWWRKFSIPLPKGTKPNKMDAIVLEGFRVYTPKQVDFAQKYLGLNLEPVLRHHHQTSREDKNGVRRFNRINACNRYHRVTPRLRLDALLVSGLWEQVAKAIHSNPSILRVITDDRPNFEALVNILGDKAEWVEDVFTTPVGEMLVTGPSVSDKASPGDEDCVLCSLAWHTDGTKNDKGYMNRTFSDFARGARVYQYYTVLVPSYTDWRGEEFTNQLMTLEIDPGKQVEMEGLSDDDGADEDDEYPKKGHPTLQRMRFTASRAPGASTSSVLGNWTPKKLLTWEQIEKMNPDAVIRVTEEGIRARLSADNGYYATVARINDPESDPETIIAQALDMFAGHTHLPQGCDFERVYRPSSRRQLEHSLSFAMNKLSVLMGGAGEESSYDGNSSDEPAPEVTFNDSDIPF